MMTSETLTCTACRAEFHWLEEFPGRICLACYARTQEGQPLPTAEELVAMWGGPVRKGRTR